MEELKAQIERLKIDLQKANEEKERNFAWFQDEKAKAKALALRLQTIKNIVEF